jgi:hypothetical protein
VQLSGVSMYVSLPPLPPMPSPSLPPLLRLLLQVELLDVLWFFPSYAALFGVIWGDLGSRLQRATGNGAWSRAPLLVGALVLSDAAENAAHLALLAKFNAAKGVKPQGWDRAAAVGSAVNQAKWWVGRVVLAGPLLWLLVAGRDALRRGK